jgi:hypothetical protein
MEVELACPQSVCHHAISFKSFYACGLPGLHQRTVQLFRNKTMEQIKKISTNRRLSSLKKNETHQQSREGEQGNARPARLSQRAACENVPKSREAN